MPSWLNSVTSGSIDTTSSSTVVLACASLKLLQRMAIAISSAASAPASGSNSAMKAAASPMPKRNIADSASLRSSHWPGRKLRHDSTAMSMPTLVTAPHLPSTSDRREAGFISKGSSEPRSRSPAVVSSAALSAPYSTAINTKNGTMVASCAAREAGSARSRSSTRTVSSAAGATPRTASRNVACSWLKARSSRSTGPAPVCERWLAALDTSSSTGGSPRARSASKPGGTTSTGSPSWLSRSACSWPSGAARTV